MASTLSVQRPNSVTRRANHSYRPAPAPPMITSYSPTMTSRPTSTSSSSSNSSSSSASSQEIATPAMRESKHLLPALTLKSDAFIRRKQVIQPSTSCEIVVIPSEKEEQQWKREQSLPTTPAPSYTKVLKTPSPPPRPPRRVSPQLPSRPRELVPPQAMFHRSTSPSESTSTISPAGTPRPAVPAYLTEERQVGKRDSVQCRLSALRGLVGTLDFGQPWSTSVSCDTPGEDVFWVHDGSKPDWQDCGGPQSQPTVTTDETRCQPEEFGRQLRLRPCRQETFPVETSGYSRSLPTGPPESPTQVGRPWRSTFTSHQAYLRVLRHHGMYEIKRQELLWELSETEHSFVKSMKTVLRLFALPLRMPSSKWIEGIPASITELFDHLEDIVHVHECLSAGLRDLRRDNETVDVDGFVQLFQSWSPRLTRHEPYLVMFEAVLRLIEKHIKDDQSVFGEFVRMQTKDKILGSMGLGSMLLKPVQRLTKYPLFLKRLLDVTQHREASHSGIMSLLSQIDSIILTLQAAKSREEECEQLKVLEARLEGLPDGFTLAVRGRKFLGQGLIVKIPPSPGSPQSLHSSRGSVSSSISSTSSSPWETSINPSSERFSITSSSTSGYGPPQRQNSVTSTTSIPVRPPSSASSWGHGLGEPIRPPTPRGTKRSKDEYTLLVFSDLVVVASSQERSLLFGGRQKKGDRLKVLPENEGGLGHVVGIKDWSGWACHTNMISLTTSWKNHLFTTCFNPVVGKSQSGILTTTSQFLSTLSQTIVAVLEEDVTSFGRREILSGDEGGPLE